MATPGAYTQASLAILTVPKLKALCKDRKIAGYSKLGKQALVQKLVDSGLCSNTTHSEALDASGTSSCNASAIPFDGVVEFLSLEATSTPAVAVLTGPAWATAASQATAAQSQPNAETIGRTPLGGPTTAVPQAAQKSQKARAKAPRKNKCTVPTGTSISSVAQAPSVVRDRSYAKLSTRPSTTNALSPRTASSDYLSVSIISKRVTILPSTMAVSTTTSQDGRPSLFVRPSDALKRSARPSLEFMPPPPAKKQRILSASLTATPVLSAPPASADAGKMSGLAIASTRILSPSLPPKRFFKPLVVNKAKLSAALSRPHVVPVSPSDRKTSSTHESFLETLKASVSAAPDLHSITMPPSLAQRKRVNGWAVILSGLSDNERAVCVLVSRAFRYAVYLSASTTLLRDYYGRRLREDVLRKYPQAMTNMWPYLRLREAEAAQRRRVYETSFLAQLLRRCGWPEPIAKRLWGSPDHPKQLLIALRFALTRAWFALSVGSPQDSEGDPRSWLNGTVLDVQQVVTGEVWSVLVDRPGSPTAPHRTEMLYVLEETCEVIGRPGPGLEPSGEEGPRLDAPELSVRTDWAVYIARRGAPGSTEPPLLSHLRWACEEDFDRGVSRLWLRKASAEGAVGDAKRAVAGRYVLACVMENSISGQWKTTGEMAQDFAGLPERVAPPTRTKGPSLNLYLPEHHLVESVHFTSSRGDALHAAVATVQTPHREYFILRDNGMQIGCEEEGVAEVWQEVLRCDHRGIPGRV